MPRYWWPALMAQAGMSNVAAMSDDITSRIPSIGTTFIAFFVSRRGPGQGIWRVSTTLSTLSVFRGSTLNSPSVNVCDGVVFEGGSWFCQIELSESTNLLALGAVLECRAPSIVQGPGTTGRPFSARGVLRRQQVAR